jgi:predicted enzyme related to lactoylglutathione lyase
MEVSNYDYGQAAWLDLTAPDPPAALAFYTELFGWATENMGGETGPYRIFTKREKPVAALHETPSLEQAQWTTYFNVNDVADTAKRVEAAGGTVLSAPTELGSAGRTGRFVDATGAPFAVWQPGDRFGAALRMEAGTYIASELGSSDLGRSMAFYSEVLGWEFSGREDYPDAKVNGQGVCGIMPAERYQEYGRPPEADAFLVSFGSDDVETDVRKASALGATVLFPPTVNYLGKFYALVRDPQGALLGLYAYESEANMEAYQRALATN